jgi:hypothetical protein
MSNLDDALKRLGDIEQLLVDYYLKQDAAYWLASVEKLRIFILSQSIEDDAKADLISHLLSAMNLPAAAIDRIHQEYTEYKGHRLSRTGRAAIKKHSTPRDAIVAKYIKASPRDTDHGIATAIFNKANAELKAAGIPTFKHVDTLRKCVAKLRRRNPA